MKTLCTPVCLAAALLVTGCQPAAIDSDTTTIGVCMSTFNSPYASAAVREFKRYAKEQQIELLLLDSQLDIQREASNIKTLIARGADAVLVNAVDSLGSRAAMKDAAQAGIPVLCFNSAVEEPEALGIRAYTGPRYYDQGVMAARSAAKLQSSGTAVMITGTPGYSAAIEREEGFTDTLRKENPEIRIRDVQTAQWMRENAQRIMSDFITKYGKEIDIVYSHDDNMTAGAVNALRTAGFTPNEKPLVVSIGAMSDGLPLVQQGWIDATILQSPRDDSRLAIDTALAILAGNQEKPFQNYYIPSQPVTAENVQDVIDMKLWE
jgi:ribose transport system substrate-binding protein